MISLREYRSGRPVAQEILRKAAAFGVLMGICGGFLGSAAGQVSSTQDECSTANWFSCGGDPFTGALLSGATPSPNQPGGLSVPDIWYPVNGRSMTVEYDDGASAGAGFIEIYAGWCGYLEPVGTTVQRGADGKFRATGLLGSGEHGEGIAGFVRIGSASTSANQSVRILCYSWNDDLGTAQEVVPGTSGCQTLSGQLLLNATSPSYSTYGEDYWASCAGAEDRTVWYHLAVAPGQTVTASYLTGDTGSVSIWSGESQWYLSEQACTAVSPTATQTSVTYTVAPGESDVWIQISGNDTFAAADLHICVSP